MAIIRCPACNSRVSDKALRCACGQRISTESSPAHRAARQRELKRLRDGLKLSMLLATVLALAGGGWIVAQSLGVIGGSVRSDPLPLVMVLAGGLWYVVARAWLWWLRR